MDIKRSTVSNNKQLTELGKEIKKAILLKPHMNTPYGKYPRNSRSTSNGTTNIAVIKSPIAKRRET